MSYILDALRKADAQRERDPARGIHAHAMNISPDTRGATAHWHLGLWLAAFAAVAALVWVGVYVYLRQPNPVRASAAPTVAAAMPVEAPALPAPVVAPSAASGTAVVDMPTVTGAVRPPPANPTMPLAHEAGANAPSSPRAPPVSTPPVSTPPPNTSLPSASPPSGTASAPAQSAVPALSLGLPPDAPKLAISGGVYSANVAARMLIVNGQVFNEGSEVGPGVVLEQVRRKSAVLRFRGVRYEVSY